MRSIIWRDMQQETFHIRIWGKTLGILLVQAILQAPDRGIWPIVGHMAQWGRIPAVMKIGAGLRIRPVRTGLSEVVPQTVHAPVRY